MSRRPPGPFAVTMTPADAGHQHAVDCQIDRTDFIRRTFEHTFATAAAIGIAALQQHQQRILTQLGQGFWRGPDEIVPTGGRAAAPLQLFLHHEGVSGQVGG